MIETNRDLNLFEVSCDHCSSETTDIDCDFGWSVMIQEIKDDGWKVRPIDDGADFEHICPACVEAENEEKDIETIIKGFPS